MIAFESDAIRRLAFLEVLDCVASGKTAELEKAGLSKNTIDRIKTAHGKDMPELEQTIAQSMKIAITFSAKSASRNPANTELATQEQAALEYFVANHATPAMLGRYFRPMSEKNIRALRAKLGATKIGRTPVLDGKTASKVFTAWTTLTKSVPNERQRYIVLHQRFTDWPLSALYGAINETGGDEK